MGGSIRLAWLTALHRARITLVVALAFAAALAACSRPIDRPLEGARPGPGGTSKTDVPPTVSPPNAQTREPIVIAASTPPPSPTTAGRPPIISGLLPPADAAIAPGQVNLGARVAGSSDLVEVSLWLDNVLLRPQVTQQDTRTWSVSVSHQFEGPGKHSLRISAKDQDGRVGGFQWSFDIGGAAGPSPQAKPR